MAAVIATLQPYLVWHDLHGNREILDQLLGAALFGLTLLAVAAARVWLGVALGVVSGVAILSNARLARAAARARAASCSGGVPAGRRRSRCRCVAVRGDGAVGDPQQGRARLLRDHDRRARALEGEQRQHLQDARHGLLDRPGARHPAAAGGPGTYGPSG